MNKHIVPDLTSREARENFADNIEAWKNFAQRITKNSYVKYFLRERDGNCCSWCHGKLIKRPIVHHIDYNHCCSFNIVISVPTPTLNDPYKTRIVPDCKSCKEQNKDRFMICMEKLALVHNICNKRIADIVMEQFKDFSKVNEVNN